MRDYMGLAPVDNLYTFLPSGVNSINTRFQNQATVANLGDRYFRPALVAAGGAAAAD